jgi:molecular chaperone IbpA
VDGLQFMHRGIAAREFERKFVLSDDVVVNGAELAHGMLSIHLEHIVPESKKPRKIEINSSGPKELKKSSKKVQFLSE